MLLRNTRYAPCETLQHVTPLRCQAAAHPAALAQVGHRKQALDVLAAAYLRGGRSAAYEAFARMPHSEAGFAGFSADKAAAELGLALA